MLNTYIHFVYLIKFEDPQMHYAEKIGKVCVNFKQNKFTVRASIILEHRDNDK